VYFFGGQVGKGKAESWATLKEDALKRDMVLVRRQTFLEALPEAEKTRLAGLSSEQRKVAEGKEPGSERSDAEETLFFESLSAEDRLFLVRDLLFCFFHFLHTCNL
jgi:hypothetical protein